MLHYRGLVSLPQDALLILHMVFTMSSLSLVLLLARLGLSIFRRLYTEFVCFVLFVDVALVTRLFIYDWNLHTSDSL